MKNNHWFTVKRVHPQVYALGEFSHWEKVVSYLFLGKTKAVLFDTGMGFGNILETVKNITKLPIFVLLTHAHWDHIGGINQFKKIGIYNDPLEVKRLAQGFHSDNIPELSSDRFFTAPYKNISFQVKGIFKPTIFNNNDVWKIDKWKIIAIHTPGHTPGSTCYAVSELKLLFTGDTVYPGPIYVQLPESDFNKYCNSIIQLERFIDDKWKILPGHNAFFTYGSVIKMLNKGCRSIVVEKISPNFIDNKGEHYELESKFSIVRK